MRIITGARFLAETLQGYGVTHVFYVEAILRRTLVEMEALGIHRVLTHGEKAAAYMADGYARASGRPGLCMAQSVGAANLAAGLQDAFLGLSPVVAITGRRPPLFQHRSAYQEIQHARMFEPVTKFGADAVSIEQLPILLRQTFREVTSGAPGPAHLDVLGHLGEEMESAQADLQVSVDGAYTRYPSFRPEPDPAGVLAAIDRMRSAARPVIVAGGGARVSSAGSEVLRLAERLFAPVATTLNGKGVIPEDHPLSAGIVGGYGHAYANRIVSEADLVVCVGSREGDQATLNWTVPAPGTPIIQVDIDPTQLGRNYPNTLGITGDARATVARLAEALDAVADRASWLERARQLRQAWWDEAAPLLRSDAVPIRPERLCGELATVLPSNAILLSDTGYSAIWTGTLVPLTHPGQTYLRAAGSLGWAFPASLGAKCASPDRPVICFIGDGGFWYHLAELETARRCGIHTVTIVNNNSGFGQCLPGIQRAYRDREGNIEQMYAFRATDFATLARDLGCWGRRVERPGDIAPALRDALGCGMPAVVDVVTDVRCGPPSLS